MSLHYCSNQHVQVQLHYTNNITSEQHSMDKSKPQNRVLAWALKLHHYPFLNHFTSKPATNKQNHTNPPNRKNHLPYNTPNIPNTTPIEPLSHNDNKQSKKKKRNNNKFTTINQKSTNKIQNPSKIKIKNKKNTKLTAHFSSSWTWDFQKLFTVSTELAPALFAMADRRSWNRRERWEVSFPPKIGT